MQRRTDGFPPGVLQAIIAAAMVLAAAGCTYKPAYLQGKKSDVPHRWTVEKVEPARLSEDQRTALERRGPPAYIRFFREVETRRPVYAWIYADEGESIDIVWFVDGKRTEDIAVDSDPSAFTSTTRRRTRIAVLVGTGVIIIPAVVLLANQ
ncbi:MAG TPA: hypothetical protein VLK82_12510 [Candidatus Tectomicrobia bacterium]|nr:hypothetical protein [Candidatus Tectomicrobia bacterium]